MADSKKWRQTKENPEPMQRPRVRQNTIKEAAFPLSALAGNELGANIIAKDPA